MLLFVSVLKLVDSSCVSYRVISVCLTRTSGVLLAYCACLILKITITGIYVAYVQAQLCSQCGVNRCLFDRSYCE